MPHSLDVIAFPCSPPCDTGSKRYEKSPAGSDISHLRELHYHHHDYYYSHITKIEPGISDPIHVFGYHFAFVQEPDNSSSSSAVVLATQQVTNSTSVSFDLLYVHAIGAFQLTATLLSSPTDQVTTTQETVTPATSHTFTIRN